MNSDFDFLKFTYDFLRKMLAKLGEYCYDINELKFLCNKRKECIKK